MFTFFCGYGRIDLMKKTAKKKNVGERPAVKKEKKDNIGPKKDEDVIYIIEEYSDPDDDDDDYDDEDDYADPVEEEKEPLHEEVKKEKKQAEKQKKGKKKKHVFLKFLFGIILVLTVVWFTLHGIITIYLSGLNKAEYEKKTAAVDVPSGAFITNMLIIGTDSRNPEDEAGRSDCILLMSVNRLSRTITLTSFLRDSYVEIPGHGSNRINAAYSFGGAPLLIETIENNYKIGIDGYFVVDFFSFIDVIDAVGGVEIDVTDEEADYINRYLCEINKILGKEQGDGNLTSSGHVKLSGKQALSYSRIRYIGTDFARTDRQREVLSALIASAKKTNPFKLAAELKDVLPSITTSIPAYKLANYVMALPVWMLFDIDQQRIPAEGTWQYFTTESGMSVIKLDFEKNTKVLWETIYDKK